ncbi:MAG: GtrA family protein [Bacilli bacterium]|nr:GtrA family protein [Bacilli bacterium]
MINRVKELYHKYEEIINYLIIGGLTTAVSLAVYYGLTLTVFDPNNALQLQITNIISWIASVAFAYFTNRKYVFKQKNKANIKEATSFCASRVSTLLIDMLLMFIFVTKLHFNDKIMKLIVQVIVIVLNYIFSKFLVFKKEK